MPRANRYILSGRTYHLTHRCHNRAFLFRFARDREEYRRRLRAAVREFEVSLLTYCITANHTHLLLRAADPERVSRMMRKLEGEFAEFYNLRKRRSGAFWNGRYGCIVAEAIRRREPQRQARWTDSIAVGSELFVKLVASEIHRRVVLKVEATTDGAWLVREGSDAYG